MRPTVCYQCGVDLEDTGDNCHRCGALISTDIPNYPRFGGGGVIVTIWVLFLVLVAVLAISWFTMD